MGFYNPHSLIAVRLLTRSEEEIDHVFFQKRIEKALTLRRQLYPTSQTFRVVHGESDYLPGLIVDKYNDCLCVQTFSYGMDKRLTMICDSLDTLLQPRAIVERNETPMRSLEGLARQKGILRGSVKAVTISEHGIHYEIDLLEGQKTGFFLDQRENRKAIRRYARNASVLDCFCNDGGFALNAALVDAAPVIGVDSAEIAVKHAMANARLNKLDSSVQFHVADAFAYLKECVAKEQRFQLINLDPPSFAKNKKGVRMARKGYYEIHKNAFKLLTPGGFLSTSSCSHHITEEAFLDDICASSRSVGRNIKLLEWTGAAPDHPVLPTMFETKYLKFGIFQVD